MNHNEIYQRLKEKYSDDEIADSVMIPAELSEGSKDASDKEIREYRMDKLRQMTDDDRILSDVMRLRFQMETYVNDSAFSFDKTFGKFLDEYLRVTKKSRREISADLALHYTKLSRIINDREEPPIELAYRLEKHSANLIHATLWWKLIAKKQEFMISKDEDARKIAYQKVTNIIRA